MAVLTMEIRLAKIEDLLQIQAVLNETTLHLLRKGINQWTYPWSVDVIEIDLKKDYLYVLLNNHQIIGTFSISNINRLSELQIEPESKYLSKIAILPEFQGRRFGSFITNYAKSYVQDSNKSLYLDCWAGNEKLKDFYKSNGFIYIGDFPEKGYFISVFKN